MAEVPRPKHQRKCAWCGGPIARRTNVAMRDGNEDDAQPFVHVHDKDWKDDPHEAVEFLVMKGGVELTYDEIQALADEAEIGYRVEQIRPRQ